MRTCWSASTVWGQSRSAEEAASKAAHHLMGKKPGTRHTLHGHAPGTRHTFQGHAPVPSLLRARIHIFSHFSITSPGGKSTNGLIHWLSHSPRDLITSQRLVSPGRSQTFNMWAFGIHAQQTCMMIFHHFRWSSREVNDVDRLRVPAWKPTGWCYSKAREEKPLYKIISCNLPSLENKLANSILSRRPLSPSGTGTHDYCVSRVGFKLR